MYKTLLPILAAIPLALGPLPSDAANAGNKQDEKKLIAKVFADGTLFGFAQLCKVPERDLKKLYDKKFATSREFGMAKVPQYSQKNFRTDFQNGIAAADKIAASVGPTSEAQQRNCAEVREKVQAIIRGK
jgi:hypothetical protein